MKIKWIGAMCGEKWYSIRSWRAYPLFWVCRSKTQGNRPIGFGIGPILFSDGT